MSTGGKGDSRRPSSVSNEQVADNWNKLFGLSKLQQRLQREQALDAMVAENQKLGLYDDFDKITRYNAETQEIKK